MVLVLVQNCRIDTQIQFLKKKMPTEQQPRDSAGEVLDDIIYLNKANHDEILRINDQIRQQVSQADLSSSAANAIVAEVSSQLGQLTVKVNLAEKAVRSVRPGKVYKSHTSPTKVEANVDRIAQKFSVDHLSDNKNLLPIEYSGDGTRYAWSDSTPEILFSFPLDRGKPLGMQICLFALIKPEYSKLLKVLVDKKHIKHNFSLDEGQFLLSCNIPPSPKTGLTDVEIILPATHSPKDLGTSNDIRRLGIAFTEIRFGNPVSRFSHLLKRLKLIH